MNPSRISQGDPYAQKTEQTQNKRPNLFLERLLPAPRLVVKLLSKGESAWDSN